MWDLLKKIGHFIMTILLYSVFIILVVIAIMVGLYFVDHYKSVKDGTNRAPLFGAYVIISPSMVPSINVLDAVVTKRVDADKLKKNDVITFISQDPRHSGITVTHRIVGIKKTESGEYAYRTKGDNNNVEDQTLVSYDKVIGKVMLKIPYIGYLQQLLTTQFGWLVVIVIPCLFIISSDLVKLVKTIVLGKDYQFVEDEEVEDLNDEEPKKKKRWFKKKKNEAIEPKIPEVIDSSKEMPPLEDTNNVPKIEPVKEIILEDELITEDDSIKEDELITENELITEDELIGSSYEEERDIHERDF